MILEELNFQSKGTRCGATLFLPEGEKKPPLVVMGHGFAAQQDFRLPAYAEKFVDRGLAVMTFDYRNFGKSDGAPRNLVNPGRHVEDWLAAIEFGRGLKQADGSRMALWGTSFSGGHVLVAAARDGRVSAVVSQVPFVDGIATAMSLSPVSSLTGLCHGLADAAISLFGKVHYVPVVTDPGRFGLMNTPDAMSGFLALVPKDTAWENKAPARIALTLAGYRPVSYASRIQCPVLMVCAEKDSLIPAAAVRKCAAKIRNARLEVLPVGHFEVYVGELFEKVSAMEADFLAEKLGLTGQR
ncbi:MAG: alpha/beta fold hydrolase [Thermodesulfobacteriota bacterium]